MRAMPGPIHAIAQLEDILASSRCDNPADSLPACDRFQQAAPTKVRIAERMLASYTRDRGNVAINICGASVMKRLLRPAMICGKTVLLAVLLALWCSGGIAADIKQTPLYTRIKVAIDAVPAIDTHDHLRPFDQLPNKDETDRGTGMTLHSIFAGSYYPGINRLSAWPAGKSFDAWWNVARHDFDDARATSFYRYLLPGFRDLYGVDFDTITDAQARELNDKIFANYQNEEWLLDVVTRRANIELMFIDPYWNRLQFARAYKFSVPVLNVSMMIGGTHPSRFATPARQPLCIRRATGQEDCDAGRLSGRHRRDFPPGRGRRHGLPEIDAGISADVAIRKRAAGAGRQGFRSQGRRTLGRGIQGIRRLHVLAHCEA